MLNNNKKEVLDWDNLKNMQCPKCANSIVREPVFEKYVCLDCDFKVSEIKFEKIVNSRYSDSGGRFINDEVEENLSGLSEL